VVFIIIPRGKVSNHRGEYPVLRNAPHKQYASEVEVAFHFQSSSEWYGGFVGPQWCLSLYKSIIGHLVGLWEVLVPV